MAVATEKRADSAESPKTPPPVEEKKPAWTHWSALSTVIMAVCATLAAMRVGSNSNKAIHSQGIVNDTWAFFQSKSIKEHSYELQKDLFELSLRQAPDSHRAEYEKKIAGYSKKLAQYAKEKDELTTKAHKVEKEVEAFRQHAATFSMSVTFLQLAILVSSVGVLMKKGLIWGSSLLLGAIGIFYFVDGFYLFY
jgi:hypothetical protein